MAFVRLDEALCGMARPVAPPPVPVVGSVVAPTFVLTNKNGPPKVAEQQIDLAIMCAYSWSAPPNKVYRFVTSSQILADVELQEPTQGQPLHRTCIGPGNLNVREKLSILDSQVQQIGRSVGVASIQIEHQ